MSTTARAPSVEPDPVSRSPTATVADGAGLSVSGVSKTLGELRVLERIELHAQSGETIGLVGRSGCGKSTLLELICGLQDPDSGTIEIAGSGPGSRMSVCAYMPQRDLLLPWLSALDNAALATRIRGGKRTAARAAAAPLFERFGLSGFEAARPEQLSGGMRQRVAFLRTLLAGKPVLLLDEPFAGLDAISRAEMQEWLAGALRSEPRTVVLVTHDVEEALYLCDRVAVLSRRPASVALELSPPEPRLPDRLRAVTSTAFIAARERALEALR